MSKDFQTKEYWNKRTKQNLKDERAMLFRDPRFDEYQERTRQELLRWHDLRVIDVACGFGRFANTFEAKNYLGVDFSEEMLKLAHQKHSDYSFQLWNAHEVLNLPVVDVVFEVNSLHCLGLTPEEFYNKFVKYAKKIVACLEADRFTIFQLY